jgi:hypothetical protein
MANLRKLGLRVSRLSGKVYIARFGKDPTLALETREALQEFIVAMLDWIGVDHEREITSSDGRKFVVSLREIKP